MPAAQLVIGPLLRHVGECDATVWVETDAPCHVSVLGCGSDTFQVAGHHYAIVHVSGLEPGSSNEYEVELDGTRVWPEDGAGLPPSAIRTTAPGRPVAVAFGSCRLSLPHEEPFTRPKDEHPLGREHDALRALSLRAMHDPDSLPDLLLLLGDQVYADELSPATQAFVRERRPPGHAAPPDQVADFEEYTHLYREAWSDPSIRWLLSTVSTAMIFDDHDIHDDWNTSMDWLETMRAKSWWDERIVGGLMSYWVYQHLGNLSPGELAADERLAEVRASEDGEAYLREFARRADRETAGTRWSYHRDAGSTRLVVIDSRAGRELRADCRNMLDPDEWRWLEEQVSGDFEHLMIATSLPWLLAPGMHHLEAWNEAVCEGAWGRLAARAGERIRQGLDLEHWGAFRTSFERLAELVRSVGAGERGRAPASITILSGDVHHAYLAEVSYPEDAGVRSAVYQAVCSPVRNPLEAREQRAVKFAASRAVAPVTRFLARRAGVPSTPIGWRLTDGPIFDNQIATLRLDGAAARLQIEKAVPAGGSAGVRLEASLDRRLA